MKQVYCASCGQPLEIKRKALPRFATIIDIVPPHQCTDEPRDLAEIGIKLNPVSVDMLYPKEKKFEQKLDNLRPPPVANTEPGDRRPKDQIKPTNIAPQGILEALKQGRVEEVEEITDNPME